MHHDHAQIPSAQPLLCRLQPTLPMLQDRGGPLRLRRALLRPRVSPSVCRLPSSGEPLGWVVEVATRINPKIEIPPEGPGGLESPLALYGLGAFSFWRLSMVSRSFGFLSLPVATARFLHSPKLPDCSFVFFLRQSCDLPRFTVRPEAKDASIRTSKGSANLN